MTIEVLTSVAELEKQIATELSNRINKKAALITEGIKSRLKPQIDEFIRESNTYSSLVDQDGDLRADFGLAAIEEVEKIIEFLIDIRVEVKGGQIIIYYETPDIQDIVLLDSVTGSVMNWVDWLLTQGDRIIIEGFSVSNLQTLQSESRSGKAIMVTGGDFRVDPRFSGTINDNWLTRILRDFLPEIKRMAESALQEVLQGI